MRAARGDPLDDGAESREAGEPELELAIERMRFALGLDDDLRRFFEPFRGDPLLGPAIRRRPWLRPRRRPWPWEALAWAITEQLIELAARGRDPAPDGPPLGAEGGARAPRRTAR